MQNLAVDVGCGGGQSTLAFAPHFKKVIGLDISAAQISEAVAAGKDVANVEFK